MVTRVLDGSPSLGGLYVKAVLPSRGRPDTLPDLRLELPGMAADLAHIAAYRDVCDLPFREALPATYPHVLAFPLHLALLTDPDFPFPPMGCVHVRNRIEQRRPIMLSESLDLAVWAERLAPHRRGRTVTIISEAAVDGAVVWRDETVLLKAGAASADVAGPPEDLPPDPPPGPARWDLPSGLGRAYAAVSGDRNPIHLYDLTARAFGFRRHIAHGMWTKARCLAELDNQLPPSFAVEVAFKKPIALPAQVTFGARRAQPDDALIDFGVAETSGKPHLVGRVSPG